MTITEVLHHATQGGYHIKGADGTDTAYAGANSEYSVWIRTDNDSSFIVPVADTFLDPHFWQALGQHLALSLTALAISVLVGVPLGIWISRRARVAELVINGFGALRLVRMRTLPRATPAVGACRPARDENGVYGVIRPRRGGARRSPKPRIPVRAPPRRPASARLCGAA